MKKHLIIALSLFVGASAYAGEISGFEYKQEKDFPHLYNIFVSPEYAGQEITCDFNGVQLANKGNYFLGHSAGNNVTSFTATETVRKDGVAGETFANITNNQFTATYPYNIGEVVCSVGDDSTTYDFAEISKNQDNSVSENTTESVE